MTEAEDCNFLVVGSGAAGLVGAITASIMGLRPLIVEKAAVWGGTTATSGGVLWVPDNDLMIRDAAGTPGAAREYVHRLLGEVTNQETAKADAFLDGAPEMARLLAQHGVHWIRNASHPDYYPEVEGSGVGRTLEAVPFDGKTLGERFRTMRGADLDIPAIVSEQFGTVARAKTGFAPLVDTLSALANYKVRRWLGQRPLGNGRALVASLMKIAMQQDIPVWLSARVLELTNDNGSVCGAVVARTEGVARIKAPAGVLLAAGGFARSASLRKTLQDRERFWTNAIAEDEGDVFAAATSLGADYERTNDCWWMPSIQVGRSETSITLGSRALPGSIVVDSSGHRYMNEAAAYMRTGKTMFENGAADANHWLIMDGRFLRRYILPELSPNGGRKAMLAAGYLHRADNIADLARKCGLDPQALASTIERFNGFARSGKDLDFGRGASDYDRYWADDKQRPNPSLAEICHPPFWAALIRPGDLGTNGGLTTDEWGRVLHTSKCPIPGLYAAGNSASSPFGRTYPGAGATIAAASTFGYLAAKHAAKLSNQDGHGMPAAARGNSQTGVARI